MTKVKHFQVKPEHVEAIQFGGRNGQEICDWVNLFADRYNITVSHTEDSVVIEHKETGVWWKAEVGNWVVRSFVNSYFYVETSAVMADQYIKL
jgi:hypothetical protein